MSVFGRVLLRCFWPRRTESSLSFPFNRLEGFFSHSAGSLGLMWILFTLPHQYLQAASGSFCPFDIYLLLLGDKRRENKVTWIEGPVGK